MLHRAGVFNVLCYLFRVSFFILDVMAGKQKFSCIRKNINWTFFHNIEMQFWKYKLFRLKLITILLKLGALQVIPSLRAFVSNKYISRS